MQFGNATMFTGALILILAVALWQSRNFGYRAGLFPWVIGIPTFVLCFLQLARDLRGTHKKTAGSPRRRMPRLKSLRQWFVKEPLT